MNLHVETLPVPAEVSSDEKRAQAQRELDKAFNRKVFVYLKALGLPVVGRTYGHSKPRA